MDLVSWHLPTGGGSAPSPRRSRTRARALVLAALLALTTFATGVELHPHREVLGVDMGHHALQGDTVSLGASHPTSALHVEATETEAAPRCPICLLHFQSATEAAGDSMAAHAPAPDGRLAAAAPAPPRAAFRLPGGSRAPPASR